MASKPVSAMTKREAAEYLTELGDKVNPSWTSLEIKSRINELLKQCSSKVKLTVSTNTKKEFIKKACEDNNVHLTGHETKGDMMRKLREKIETDSEVTAHTETKADMMRKLREKIEIDPEVTAHTLMTIGRHSGKPFREIRQLCPTYVTWVRTTVKENPDTHWKFKQFARWIDRSELEEALLAQDEETDGPPEEAARTSSGRFSCAGAARTPLVKKPSVVAVPMDVKPGARKVGRRGPTVEENLESAAGSSTAQDKMMGMMQKMAEKISQLEIRNKELEDKADKTEKESTGEEAAPKDPGSRESEGSWAQLP